MSWYKPLTQGVLFTRILSPRSHTHHASVRSGQLKFNVSLRTNSQPRRIVHLQLGGFLDATLMQVAYICREKVAFLSVVNLPASVFIT